MGATGTKIKVESLDALDSAEANSLILEKADHKTYSYTGTLEVNTGERRLYMTRTGAFGDFDMFVATAPVGASVNVTVNKNGSQMATGTLSAGATSSLANAIPTAQAGFESGDYLTVDITQVGSTTAGEDLYINFKITG